MKIECSREELRLRYAQAVRDNPLLGRIEAECRTIAWTDEEIRTLQLLAAVQSNASLQERVRDVEERIAATKVR